MARTRRARKASNLVVIPTAFVLGLLSGWLVLFFGGFAPSLVPIGSATIGLFVAFTVPIWQALYLNASKLAIEISSIRRTISETAAISVQDDPELAILSGGGGRSRRNVMLDSFDGDGPPGRKLTSGETLETLDYQLRAAKQRLRDLPEQVEERKRELDRAKALDPATITKYDLERLNRPLWPEVEYEAENKNIVVQDLIAGYTSRLEEAEKEYSDLQKNLPIAERKLEVVKQALIDNKSLFTVSVSLINSGRSNTAIKVPALMRVLIGQGNYIDIKLSLKDFENKSEIQANGTRIAVFESLEISSLPEEDRSLINTYWGQSVRAWLLVEDIHGDIVRSNPIAFAEGLYQKIIYDRLARAAGGVRTDA